MASAWEDSWGLSGSFSHLKHKVYGAEPISSKAATPAAGWGGRRHGAGADWTQNKWEQPGCLAGAGGEDAGQVTAEQPAASAPAAWLWSAGTCPSLPRSDASRPLSPSEATEQMQSRGISVLRVCAGGKRTSPHRNVREKLLSVKHTT